MAEDLRFSVIATDEASDVLGDVGQAAEGVGEAFAGPATHGAQTFTDSLSRTEAATTDTRQASERLGDTLKQDTTASLRESDTTSENWAASLRLLLESVQRAEAGVTELEAKVKEYADRADKAEAGNKRWFGSFVDIKAGIDLAVQGISTLINLGADFLSSTVDNAAQVGRFAQVLGLTTEQMSSLQFAFGTVGVELDDVRDALGTAAEGMSEFITLGSGPAEEALRVLNLRLEDTPGKLRPIGTLLPELADRLAAVKNPADQLRFAIQLFGEEAAYRTLPLLQQGGAGIEALQAQAESLGVTISGPLVQQSQQFQSGLFTVGEALRGVGLTIVEAVLPGLNAVIPRVLEFIQSFRQTEAFDALVAGIQTAISWVTNLVTHFDNIVAIAQTVGTVMSTVFDAAVTAIEAAWTTADVLFLGFADAARALAPLFAPVGEAIASWLGPIGSVGEAFDLVKGVIILAGAGILDVLRGIALAFDGLLIAGEAVAGLVPGLGGVERSIGGVRRSVEDAAAALETQRDRAFEAADAAFRHQKRNQTAQEETTKAITGTTAAIVGTKTAMEQVTPAVIESLKKQQDAFAQTTAASQALTQSAGALGIKTREALEKEVQRMVASFEAAVASIGPITQDNLKDLQRYYAPVADKFEEVTGRIPPTFEAAMRQALDRAGQDSSQIGELLKGGIEQGAKQIPGVIEFELSRAAKFFEIFPAVAGMNAAEATKQIGLHLDSFVGDAGAAGQAAADNLGAKLIAGIKTTLTKITEEEKVAAATAGRDIGNQLNEGFRTTFSNLDIDGHPLVNRDIWRTRGLAAGNAYGSAISGKFQNVTDTFLTQWEAALGGVEKRSTDSVRFVENKFGELVPIVVDRFGRIDREATEKLRNTEREVARTAAGLQTEFKAGGEGAAAALQGLGNTAQTVFNNIGTQIINTGDQVSIFAQTIQNAAGIVGGAFGEIVGAGTEFATTIEGLRSQISDYQFELRNLSILIDQAGISTGAYSARKEFLIDVINELGARLRELEAEQSDYNDTLIEGTAAVEEIAVAYDQVARSSSQARVPIREVTDEFGDANETIDDLITAYELLGVTVPDVARANALEQITAFDLVARQGQVTVDDLRALWQTLGSDLSTTFFGVQDIGSATIMDLKRLWGEGADDIVESFADTVPIFQRILQLIDTQFTQTSNGVLDLSAALQDLKAELQDLANQEQQNIAVTQEHIQTVKGLSAAVGEFLRTGQAAGSVGGGSLGFDAILNLTTHNNTINVQQGLTGNPLIDFLNEARRRGDLQLSPAS